MSLSASKNLSMMKALEGHFLKAPSRNIVFGIFVRNSTFQEQIMFHGNEHF